MSVLNHKLGYVYLCNIVTEVQEAGNFYRYRRMINDRYKYQARRELTHPFFPPFFLFFSYLLLLYYILYAQILYLDIKSQNMYY